MKRRLMNTYDRIVMPEDCARRIEGKIQQAIRTKESGTYSRNVAPSVPHPCRWAVAAVMVFLVICLGASLIPRLADRMENTPMTSRNTTPEDHYSMATSVPPEEVEAFAEEIRQNVLDGNWEAFAEKVNYPITILDKIIGNDGGLVGLIIRNKVEDEFFDQLQKETCEEMFCNWQGICMADGRIWINEADGQLKITAINGMFGDLVNAADFQFTEIGKGSQAVVAYTGRAEEVTFPSGRNQDVIVQIGTGTPVIRNGALVKHLQIPAEVKNIGNRAFADCAGLETVRFLGDAPECGADIFAGSENVTVYYQEGTSGWTNPWQGRPALPYEKGHISLGNVQISTKDQEEANIWYDGVLRDNRQIEFPEWNTQYTISQYCQRRSAETGKEVTCPQFTLVDIDDDGVKELILRIRPEGEPLDDYLIVRYQKSGVYDGIYCYAELRQMISGLKKDGAFFWEKENARWVASLEALGNGAEKGLSVPEAAQRCPVRWHSTSVVDPFFVLDSYVIIGEEVRGEVLGGQFFYFEQMLAGKLDGDWKKLQEHLQLNGFRCEAENGTMAIYDPASPGCVLFGTMNENNCLDSIGYYICDETGEKMAEVRNICSGAPEYRVDVNLVWEQETLGRPVSSPEEVLQYFRS